MGMKQPRYVSVVGSTNVGSTNVVTCKSIVHDYPYGNSSDCLIYVASSPGHSQILSHSREKKLGEGLGSLLLHRPEMVDTIAIRTESTLCTTHVHHFRSVT